MSAPIRFGIIGGGWRAEFFTRIVQQVPERFALAGVTLRDPAKGEAFAQALGDDELSLDRGAGRDRAGLRRPFGAGSTAHLELLTECHRLGLAVLCETPAGPDVESMIAIWRLVEDGLKLQIAEQYLYQPLHAARLAVIADGRLGPVSSARVSAAHGYHGVSLMRKFLGIGFEDATIRGREFRAPLVEGANRDGPPKRSSNPGIGRDCIGEFDFGDRLGIFNFIDMQYWSYARAHHVVIRGERGEIADLDVRWMRGRRADAPAVPPRRPRAVRRSRRLLARGHRSSATTYASRNPFWRARLMDDEIAIAIAFEKMAAFARGEGEGPYSFAEGAQDQYLSLLMIEAAKTGEVGSRCGSPGRGDRSAPVIPALDPRLSRCKSHHRPPRGRPDSATLGSLRAVIPASPE